MIQAELPFLLLTQEDKKAKGGFARRMVVMESIQVLHNLS